MFFSFYQVHNFIVLNCKTTQNIGIGTAFWAKKLFFFAFGTSK
jgi:hypothetical protein